jgi:hypothetical protein
MKLWSNWRNDTSWTVSVWFYCLSLCGLILFASFREFGSVKVCFVLFCILFFFFFFFYYLIGLVFRNYCSGRCVLDSSNWREGAVDLLNKVRGPSCTMNFVRNYLSSLLATTNSWMTSVVTAAGNKSMHSKMFGKSCGRGNGKRKKGFCHPLLLRCYLHEEYNTVFKWFYISYLRDGMKLVQILSS